MCSLSVDDHVIFCHDSCTPTIWYYTFSILLQHVSTPVLSVLSLHVARMFFSINALGLPLPLPILFLVVSLRGLDLVDKENVTLDVLFVVAETVCTSLDCNTCYTSVFLPGSSWSCRSQYFEQWIFQALMLVPILSCRWFNFRWDSICVKCFYHWVNHTNRVWRQMDVIVQS